MQVPAGPAQLKRFKDPIFRISNLYSIRTREGEVIPCGVRVICVRVGIELCR
jgi:hypothetical protein